MELDLTVKGKPDQECKGIYLRCAVNNYWDQNRGQAVFQTKLTVLKRRSCPGCDMCRQFHEDLAMVGMEVFGDMRTFKSEDGAVYELVFVPGVSDWETGILDEWGWDLRKVVGGRA